MIMQLKCICRTKALKVIAQANTWVDAVATEMQMLADQLGCPVECEFNGSKLRVEPGKSTNDALAEWSRRKSKADGQECRHWRA